MIAYAIMLQAFSSLIITIVAQRESGQLKRLRGTPMRAWTLVVAQALRAIILVVLMIVALLIIGVAAYGVHVRAESLIGIAVYAALGTAAMATLGLALTPFLPTSDTAASVGPFAAVLLSFISGVFVPVDVLPHWLAQIGRIFPLFHLAEGLQRALHSGTGLTVVNVVILAAWALAGLIVAARRFRWEPLAA